ncbi:MAG: ion channel [Thermomicrobiales bacterium]
MNYIMLFAGIAIILIAVVDILWTTLWVDGGAGPVSSRLTDWIWKLGLIVGRRRHRLLSVFGPITLVLTVAVWVALLWLGWVILFEAQETSILRSQNQAPVDMIGIIYFVGYALFTMGNGDFSPNGEGWEIATALTNASGMLLITLTVTYLLSVISAVVHKRSVALQVTGIGRTPDAFLRNSWSGQDFRNLDLVFQSLSADVSRLCEQFRAYPILQYYHAETRTKSSAIGIALVDEAVTILTCGVPEDTRPNRALLLSLRSSLDMYLESIDQDFGGHSAETPPAPDLRQLQKAGIPTLGETSFGSALEDQRSRRRQLLTMVREDGWEWFET